MNDGFINLAAEIIMRALDDIKTMSPKGDEYKDADDFFKSEWFEQLSDATGAHPDEIRRKVYQTKRQRAGKWLYALRVFPVERARQKARIRAIWNRDMKWTQAVILAWEGQQGRTATPEDRTPYGGAKHNA